MELNVDFRRVSEVDGGRLLAQIKRHGVSTCTASPPFVDRLVEEIAATGRNAVPRRILTGGAPVPDTVLRRWQAALPDTEITVVYGSTEAEPVASMSLIARLEVAGEGTCVGKPVEGVAARLIRIAREPLVFRDWTELDVPADGIGELIVSGARSRTRRSRAKSACPRMKSRGLTAIRDILASSRPAMLPWCCGCSIPGWPGLWGPILDSGHYTMLG